MGRSLARPRPPPFLNHTAGQPQTAKLGQRGITVRHEDLRWRAFLDRSHSTRRSSSVPVGPAHVVRGGEYVSLCGRTIRHSVMPGLRGLATAALNVGRSYVGRVLIS